MSPRRTDRFFVLTGGPGSGKTTLLRQLEAEAGIHVMEEAGRAIIRDQMLIGGRALPWDDRAIFAELMLASDMRAYADASDIQGPVIFDRGVPDVIGYLKLCRLAVPTHMEAEGHLFRYSPTVLIAPPWLEVYATDAERKQSFEEAQATYSVMLEVYGSLGYDLVELPRDSVTTRVRFVRDLIAYATAGSLESTSLNPGAVDDV